MYSRPQPEVEKGRITRGKLASTASMGNNGAFIVKGPEFAKLFIIASNLEGWEHVSVSVLKNNKRCPTWGEMSFVKDLFWQPEEAVMQLHPPKSQYVSFHDYTLHLWRPLFQYLPLPPHTMVGPKTVEESLELLSISAGGKRP